MAFDSAETLENMANAVRDVVASDWPKVRSCVERALKDQEEALKEIAATRLENELTDEEMKSELEDEKKTFEAALLACEVRAKAMAQQAANAAFQVLEQAIKVAL